MARTESATSAVAGGGGDGGRQKTGRTGGDPLWTLGGLSPVEVVRRTVVESWRDDVFGQGGRMAFYHFLAIFPSLLVFLALSQRIPHLGNPVRGAVGELTNQVLPPQVSGLVQTMMQELTEQRRAGWRLISVCVGAVWAALNGTWAMVYGLNNAYEVEERRSRWKLALTIVGLTASIGVAATLAVFLIFCSGYVQARLHGGVAELRVLEWLALMVMLSLTLAVLYRFAPSLQDHEWRWSTPGALCALVLWTGSTFAARMYFEHVNNYAHSYGHLNVVVMLLLWLYVTNGAILIGGEMNSEIEKAAEKRGTAPARRGQGAKRTEEFKR